MSPDTEATARVHHALDNGETPAREDVLLADVEAVSRWQCAERVLALGADCDWSPWTTRSTIERAKEDAARRQAKGGHR